MDNDTGKKFLELNKTFWSDAASHGGIIGLLLFVLALIETVSGKDGYGTFISFVILIVCISFFGRQRSLKYGNLGFSFGQSMSYVFAMMLFTGIISGLGNYVLYNFIAPDYYESLLREAISGNPMMEQYTGGTGGTEQFMGLLSSVMKNPLTLLLGSIFTWIFFGGLVGLAASIFIRRNPDHRADYNSDDDEQ